MNLLHDIPPGDPHKHLNVVVEIPMGSRVKYEFNTEKQIMVANRFLFTAFTYPFNYGFIPGTWSGDNDPLDIVVVASDRVYPGCLIECRVIGVLETEDEEGKDAKIIAVPKAKVDPVYANVDSIDDLPEHVRNKIKHFFENYKSLEPGKWVKVTGWQSREVAIKSVEEYIARYTKHFPK